MPELRPFHLAFPVHDLATAREFWGGVIGGRVGRSSDQWVDFDFHGHQIVASLVIGAGMVAENSSVQGPSGVASRIFREILAKAHVEHFVGLIMHDSAQRG